MNATNRWVLSGFASLAASTAIAGAPPQLIWDNYLSPPNGHDGTSAMSSERNTIIADSWTVDDVVLLGDTFPGGLVINEIRWIGMRDPAFSYPNADFLVLDNDGGAPGGTIFQGMDVSYSATVIGANFGMETYEGVITGLNISLPAPAPGENYEFFVGARLVGANALGRNYLATTGSDQPDPINGQTEGFFMGASFGVPDWLPVSQVPNTASSDFAFQVFGTAIPEPATIGLIALGGLTIRRRR